MNKIEEAIFKITDFDSREKVKAEYKNLVNDYENKLKAKDEEIENLKYQIKMFYA